MDMDDIDSKVDNKDAHTPDATDNGGASTRLPASTKLRLIVHALQDIAQREPDTKCLVFSQVCVFVC